jgi:hypothetical protein
MIGDGGIILIPLSILRQFRPIPRTKRWATEKNSQALLE